MSKKTYMVIATRECLYSTTLFVDAETPEQAQELAYEEACDDTGWEAGDSWLTKPDIDLQNIIEQNGE